ncbi:hypothetical protein [Spirosoma sp. KCTC 42546]|uniref:hypothetical protein n=1 Tax=Spirosoma sp. KCTC 42546 TaxID=2520506 RepID=UPI00143D8AC7|nr:hypothetical protein [Spirosoma sp. KCTC 42546]
MHTITIQYLEKNQRRLHVILLFMLIGNFFSACKQEENTPVTPDPLANAAGTYTGSMADNGKITQGVKATVTKTKDSYGKLYISSVGFSGTNYQLVLTGNCSGCLAAKQNGYDYRDDQASADGKTLNVRGRYTPTGYWDLSSTIYRDFSFTGTR